MADFLYRQIADYIERQIESGELARGAKLPTEIELREQYQASRNTVRDAIKWLTIRGLLESRAGQGTFVVDKKEPFINTLIPREGGRTGDAISFYIEQVAARRRKSSVRKPEVRMELATASLARLLGITEGDQVVSRDQKRMIDGSPWSRQVSYYPMSLVHSGAARLLSPEDIEEGTVAYLREDRGIDQVGIRDLIAMRTPDADEAGYFGIPPDGRIPVFEITRIAFDQKGEPFRVTITTYPADRNLFMIEIGEVPADHPPAAPA